MKKSLIAIFILMFPLRYIRSILSLLGHEIEKDCIIGFSWLYVDKIVMRKGSRVGNFNFIEINNIELESKAWIGSNNIIRGDINVNINCNGSIGRKNRISRAQIKSRITYNLSYLSIGTWGQIVHNCMIDCTRSIYIGDYTTVGGSNTQMWTHGYYHANTGIERIRIDGEINIGNNVYVGSRCTFMPGVKVADGIHIGANCCISKSLEKSGMYVSQPLRYIENDIDSIREKLDKVEGYDLCEEVYEKKI